MKDIQHNRLSILWQSPSSLLGKAKSHYEKIGDVSIMLRTSLETFVRKPTRKISLKHVILPLFVLLFSGAFVSHPVHAVGSGICAITADFHLDVSVENFNVLPGATGTATVTVTPLNGLFGPPVTLSTANLPPEIISLSLSPTTLDIN